MQTLFDPGDRQSILARLQKLEAGRKGQWGKMNPAQMLTHCALVLEMATAEKPVKQKLIGRILSPLVRKGVLGEKAFGKNSPTDPGFVVLDEREFEHERRRLVDLVDRFVKGGPSAAAKQVHTFFGKLSGEEWGTLMHKHLDHHLRQFDV